MTVSSEVATGGSSSPGGVLVAARRTTVALLQRTHLNKVAHRLYYRYVHGFASASPGLMPALDRCFAEAATRGTLQQGDYLEFGVFKGYAFWYAQQAARRYRAPRLRFFGFDSFNGLPEVENADHTAHNEFYRGQFCCSKQRVIDNLNTAGVDWTRTFLIEGYFEQSLTNDVRRRHGIEKAPIILIDCDLYSSTSQVLQFVAPMIMDQTIVLMDDWNCFNADNERGQRRAFREFLAGNPQLRAEPLFAYGPYGQTFLMRRPVTSANGA